MCVVCDVPFGLLSLPLAAAACAVTCNKWQVPGCCCWLFIVLLTAHKKKTRMDGGQWAIVMVMVIGHGHRGVESDRHPGLFGMTEPKKIEHHFVFRMGN